jgi:enoyl-CoA hydratase
VTIGAELAARAPLAFRLAKAQLRAPALERIRSGAGIDVAAAAEWGAPHTAQRLSDQLAALSGGR